MSGFKYGVGDILEDESGRIVKIAATISDSPRTHLAKVLIDDNHYKSYTEDELTYPKATHFKVGQTVEVVSDYIAEVGVIGERGFVRDIEDPVRDNLPIWVEMESGDEWYFSPIELKVVEDAEEGKDDEIAFYRQEVERLEEEVKVAQIALKRSLQQCQELSYMVTDVEYTCRYIAENIASLREEHRKLDEEYDREENASE